MKDSRTSSIVLHNLLIAVLAFIWLIPIIWLLCTSFSAYSGMNTSTFFPKEWSISNYMKLFHSDSVSQFPQWFLNTFIIACFTCVISTMFVLMVAYATSVMRFKMRKPLMNMAVILNLFPGMLAMIAVYFTLKSFNLTNNNRAAHGQNHLEEDSCLTASINSGSLAECSRNCIKESFRNQITKT